MKKGEGKLMAKPIESTPVLKGKDLINFAQSLKKEDTAKSLSVRKAALSLLEKVTQ